MRTRDLSDFDSLWITARNKAKESGSWFKRRYGESSHTSFPSINGVIGDAKFVFFTERTGDTERTVIKLIDWHKHITSSSSATSVSSVRNHSRGANPGNWAALKFSVFKEDQDGFS